jgi:predicted dithiol-disulfide oxidoreductase (DUF899 family)
VNTGPGFGAREDSLRARIALLEREKTLTRLSDELARERQALPWVRVEKDYRFDANGTETSLSELFDGRSQLLVYHFMFGPTWTEGCPSCSLLADHFEGALPHVNERDVTLLCVSRAPLEKLNQYKRRMGWRFPWVSSLGSDFNFDLQVSFTAEEQADGAEYNFAPIACPPEELPGISAFVLDDGAVYHTYSSYARGGDVLTTAYQLLDRAPKGRDEDDLPWTMSWVRRHDEYQHNPR